MDYNVFMTRIASNLALHDKCCFQSQHIAIKHLILHVTDTSFKQNTVKKAKHPYVAI